MVPLLLSACQSRPAAPPRSAAQETVIGLSRPVLLDAVEALCMPPLGWTPEPLKSSDRHTHQVWISPTGNTAYGVMHIRLPLPVGPGVVLWAFQNEMRRRHQESIILDQMEDRSLPGLRFIAEGGPYRIRVNLITRGRGAWVIYAGTLRHEPEVPEELRLAERAREHTAIGLQQYALSSLNGESWPTEARSSAAP